MDCLVRDWGREKVPCGLPLSMVRPLPFWWSCSAGAGVSAQLDALPAVTLPLCAFQLAHCATTNSFSLPRASGSRQLHQ